MRINGIQNKNITFNAGLTSKMKSEIKCCDVKKIEDIFLKKDIITEFNNNKTLAWCCLKTFQLLEFLNKNYKLNLAYPKGIFVDDFKNLKVKEDTPAFCNNAPAILYKDNDIIVPENVIFINNYSWENIDEVADLSFENSTTPTDYFLYPFLHEFAHVIHNSHLINLCGGNIYISILEKAFNPEFLDKFRKKYSPILAKLCEYSYASPLEAIGCDLGYRLSQGLDKNNITHQKNPLEKSPYVKKSFFCKENKYDKTIRKIYNGDF